MGDEYMAVNKLHTQSERISVLIARLEQAGLMKKADLAQAVIDAIYVMQCEQNKIINTMVNDLLNMRIELDALKQRAGL